MIIDLEVLNSVTIVEEENIEVLKTLSSSFINCKNSIDNRIKNPSISFKISMIENNFNKLIKTNEDILEFNSKIQREFVELIETLKKISPPTFNKINFYLYSLNIEKITESFSSYLKDKYNVLSINNKKNIYEKLIVFETVNNKAQFDTVYSKFVSENLEYMPQYAYAIYLIKKELRILEESKIQDLFPDNIINVGSTDDKSNSRVLDLNVNLLLEILNNNSKFNNFYNKQELPLEILVDYNIYLHAFDVLYHEVDGIALELSQEQFERLKELSKKYNQDLSTSLEGQVSALNRIDEDLKTATLIKNDKFNIYSSWNDEKNINRILLAIDKMPEILKNNLSNIYFSTEKGIFPYNAFVFSIDNFVASAATMYDSREGIYFWGGLEYDDTNHVIDILYHEAAHVLDNINNISSNQNWIDASIADGDYPSSYASMNGFENFAVSVEKYYSDYKVFKDNFPNRAKYLDNLFKDQDVVLFK